MGIRARRDHPAFSTIDLLRALMCREQRQHTQPKDTPIRTHCNIFCYTNTRPQTFPWWGNQLLQCLSVITPYSSSDGCNTLWLCKMCFGNVFGIALWHCWMLWEWNHNMLRETVIPLWSKWQAAASLKWLIGVCAHVCFLYPATVCVCNIADWWLNGRVYVCHRNGTFTYLFVTIKWLLPQMTAILCEVILL